MNFWDIINPWGALRRERRQFVILVSDYENAFLRSEDALRMAQQRADELETKLIDAKNQLLSSRMRADKLRRTIARGHFRNPETGRIGPKGVTYE